MSSPTETECLFKAVGEGNYRFEKIKKMAKHEMFTTNYEGYDNISFVFERVFVNHLDKNEELVYRVSVLLGINNTLYFRVKNVNDKWTIEDTTQLQEWMKNIEHQFSKSIELNEE